MCHHEVSIKLFAGSLQYLSYNHFDCTKPRAKLAREKNRGK